MHKILPVVFGLLLCCSACNTNTPSSTAPAATPTDSVSAHENVEEEDTAFQEVLELPFKK